MRLKLYNKLLLTTTPQRIVSAQAAHKFKQSKDSPIVVSLYSKSLLLKQE